MLPPVKVRVELVVVDGPEGQHLRQRQAEAVRAALRWLAEDHVRPGPYPDPE